MCYNARDANTRDVSANARVLKMLTPTNARDANTRDVSGNARDITPSTLATLETCQVTLEMVDLQACG